MPMQSQAKKVTLCASLAVLAVALSAFERIIPITALMPVPFFKIGLANLVTLFAVFYLDKASATIIVIVRTFLSAALFGGITAFFYSVSGGLAALGIMLILKGFEGERLSCYGISVAGAAAHGAGQIAAAAIMLGSAAAFRFLPYMLLIGIPTGLLIAFIYSMVARRIVTNKIITW